jgi:hypothetical protein
VWRWDAGTIEALAKSADCITSLRESGIGGIDDRKMTVYDLTT